MVQGITSQAVGGAEPVLSLLCCHHHFVKGKRILVEADLYSGDVFADLYLRCHRDIAQTGHLQLVFSGLYIFEDKASVSVGDGPEVVASQSYGSSGYRHSGTDLRNQTLYSKGFRGR